MIGRPITVATSSTTTTGEVVGTHEGTYAYTIGQRRGLRLGRPAPDGKPRFVLDIEPVSGTVTVGPRERLAIRRISAFKPRWCGTAPTSLDGTVQLRAHGDEHRATVTVEDGIVIVDRTTRAAIAPGQAGRARRHASGPASATITATER